MSTKTAQTLAKRQISAVLAGIRKSPRIRTPKIIQDDQGDYIVLLSGYVGMKTLVSHFYDAGFVVLSGGVHRQFGHYVKLRSLK